MNLNLLTFMEVPEPPIIHIEMAWLYGMTEYKDKIHAILGKFDPVRDSTVMAAEAMHESTAAWNKAHTAFIKAGDNKLAKFAAEQASLSTEAATIITKICNANNKIWKRDMFDPVAEMDEDVEPTP